MRAKAQLCWAIVHTHGGHIDSSTISFNRGDVIADKVAEYRGYPRFVGIYPNLTDAQLWRVIKRKRGICCRRISMRVAT